jgi:T5SS/PEP-CTERM-associated repeat protein
MSGVTVRSATICMATFVAAVMHCRMASATNYFRTNPGSGAFANADQWTPHFAPLLSGPGGADDIVSFNLGLAPLNRYAVTGVAGVNSRLRVGDDSLSLHIGTYTLTDPSTSAPSLSIGLLSGDVADVVITGDAGSLLQTESVGMAFIAGSFATLSVDHCQWLSKGHAIIGHTGEAALNVNQEAEVIHTGNSWIGLNEMASGEVNVDGAGSQWTTTNQLVIGAHGHGDMYIKDGGAVVSTIGDLGREATGNGNVSVSGANSTWANTSTLTVGNRGKAQLSASSGGLIANGSAAVGVHPTSDGEVVISNGGEWLTNGSLTIGGGLPGSGMTNGNGNVKISSGGSTRVTGTTTLYGNGSLNLEGGVFAAATVDVQGGQFNWAGGDLQVGLFQGNLVNQGGALTPGGASIGSTTVNGAYSQLNAGSLEFEIGGLSPGGSYDLVGITGSAILAGQLEIRLTNAFLPTPNDTLTILNAAGGLFGVFNNVAGGQRLSTLDGNGSFTVNYGIGSPYNQNQIVLSNFQPTLTADFDHDGDVDGNDLGVWKTSMEAGNGASGDADGDGDSDGGDFLVWQRQFTGAASQLSAANVPEPSSLLMALLAIGLAPIRRSICSRR